MRYTRFTEHAVQAAVCPWYPCLGNMITLAKNVLKTSQEGIHWVMVPHF